jgi:hypothetical protein
MDPSATRRRLLTVTGLAGIGYALSWIAGLSVPAPSPKLTASGAEIALARAARRSGAAEAARVALIAGGAAALISLLQFALGAALAVTTTSATAHLLYDAVNRLDGVKMLALAGLGLAGAASGALPRWLRYTGIGLAIAIATSSVAYLLLVQGLAVLAVPAGVLLLVFITGTGSTLGTSTNKPSRNTPAARKADAEAGALS